MIDEEQRFGVRHKERLRQLRRSVDVLTLTATPIPRTLQMSLMGLREMSLIETPPRDRTPIVTWVSEFDEDLIEDAIRREVDRGGQVFYVHNRVQTIDGARRLVESLAPEVRVAVAHGQMPEKELERVMVALFHREVDVLVTSTIIESGLDVPSANTIVVARADRFGLADLYQLRGRVGRSHHRAYCYLLTPPRDAMTPEAEKRLRVLEEHTDLGAGYRIALHDLEMRGAGNLLGADQSGFIAAVGFETYLRLLEETIQKLKGEEERPAAEPELAFDADAFLPDRYVPDSQQKLALYRRLSACATRRRSRTSARSSRTATGRCRSRPRTSSTPSTSRPWPRARASHGSGSGRARRARSYAGLRASSPGSRRSSAPQKCVVSASRSRASTPSVSRSQPPTTPRFARRCTAS